MAKKPNLKRLAKTYRKTKVYPLKAKIAEYEYLLSQFDSIEKEMRHDLNTLSLKTLVDITIGMWQAHHKFYLTSRQVIKKLRKRT